MYVAMCEDYIRYQTQSSARRCLPEIEVPDGWRGVVTFCENCRGWHIVIVLGRIAGGAIDPYASCHGKKWYSDREFARRVARYVKSKRGTDLRVYPCRLCGGWHVTKRESWEV